MSEGSHNWQPLRPDQIQELLKDLPIPWWIAGGWAIDLFLGRESRAHQDTDVLILRKDQLALQQYLADWDLHKTRQPGLKPWRHGEYLPPGVNDIWCRRDHASPWLVQFMLLESEGDRWVYRRESKVRGAISDLGLRSQAGIPYLKPELQLLYKARPEPQWKDQHDFDLVVPRLGQSSRDWLLAALSLQFKHGHRWIDRLKTNI
jgi:hypothetical protein